MNVAASGAWPLNVACEKSKPGCCGGRVAEAARAAARAGAASDEAARSGCRQQQRQPRTVGPSASASGQPACRPPDLVLKALQQQPLLVLLLLERVQLVALEHRGPRLALRAQARGMTWPAVRERLLLPRAGAPRSCTRAGHRPASNPQPSTLRAFCSLVRVTCITPSSAEAVCGARGGGTTGLSRSRRPRARRPAHRRDDCKPARPPHRASTATLKP